jgi:hypothetical protein
MDKFLTPNAKKLVAYGGTSKNCLVRILNAKMRQIESTNKIEDTWRQTFIASKKKEFNRKFRADKTQISLTKLRSLEAKGYTMDLLQDLQKGLLCKGY